MLLWSILHLTGVQAVDKDYERLGQPSVTLDDIRRYCMKTFLASAPLKELQKKFGFDPDHAVEAARNLLGRK